jgi:hypothetical protein
MRPYHGGVMIHVAVGGASVIRTSERSTRPQDGRGDDLPHFLPSLRDPHWRAHRIRPYRRSVMG